MPSNSLRSEIAYSLAETFALDMSNPKSIEYAAAFQEADRALALVASKMPEKKDTRTTNKNLGMRMDALHEGWNAYHDTFKSILKGEE